MDHWTPMIEFWTGGSRGGSPQSRESSVSVSLLPKSSTLKLHPREKSSFGTFLLSVRPLNSSQGSFSVILSLRTPGSFLPPIHSHPITSHRVSSTETGLGKCPETPTTSSVQSTGTGPSSPRRSKYRARGISDHFQRERGVRKDP